MQDHELVNLLLKGNRRALARAITRVESGGPPARAVLAGIYPHTGRARIVGITGPPGAGKSTLVNSLAAELRRRDRSVGIIAVDPSSPFSGGAILGDRIRMQPLGGDAGVFIRSMASRGRLGGLARATADAALLLDAAGFDIVLIETVGAGQSEVNIAAAAQTTVVVEVPGMGDDVQSIKAGMLEIADVFVVNKADRDGADRTVALLKAMLKLGDTQSAWSPPVIPAVAMRDSGSADIIDAIEQHGAHLRESDGAGQRLQQAAARELRAAVEELILEHLHKPTWDQQVSRIAARQTDPYSAAIELIDGAMGR